MALTPASLSPLASEPVGWLCIINNNKLAQSGAVIQSLLSADINGIPSSDFLYGYLIGRHMGKPACLCSRVGYVPLVSGPPPGRALSMTHGPGDYCKRIRGCQGPRGSAWRFENKGNVIPQTKNVALASDLTCSETNVY